MTARYLAALLAAATVLGLTFPAGAAEAVSFEGKSIKVIIPTTAGGGTDISARLFGRFLGKYLPGKPAVVPQNMPGGGGVTPLNFFAQQVKPDGLTIVFSSSTEADPLTFRAPQAQYNPAKFGIIGGFGLGDQLLVIRTEALPRLLDKTQPPVAMGTVAGQPRGGMRMTLWGNRYLGWNTKWVTGYPGSSDLLLAIERGEIDMTSFAREYIADKLTDTSRYRVLYADGLGKHARSSGRADFDNAPKFVDVMEGKIQDQKMHAAYDYWRAGFLFKWVSLPPHTPQAIIDVYRDAFRNVAADDEFTKAMDQVMQGYTVLPPEEMAEAIDDLAATPDEALKTTAELLRSLR
jgi:tripartite-type tricarboxylate transporter receptor subunit TctC